MALAKGWRWLREERHDFDESSIYQSHHTKKAHAEGCKQVVGRAGGAKADVKRQRAAAGLLRPAAAPSPANSSSHVDALRSEIAYIRSSQTTAQQAAREHMDAMISALKETNAPATVTAPRTSSQQKLDDIKAAKEAGFSLEEIKSAGFLGTS